MITKQQDIEHEIIMKDDLRGTYKYNTIQYARPEMAVVIHEFGEMPLL